MWEKLPSCSPKWSFDTSWVYRNVHKHCPKQDLFQWKLRSKQEWQVVCFLSHFKHRCWALPKIGWSFTPLLSGLQFASFSLYHLLSPSCWICRFKEISRWLLVNFSGLKTARTIMHNGISSENNRIYISWILKRALISGCLLVRICFLQTERILPSGAEINQTSTSWVFTDCHWFKKNRPHAAQRAQFPAIERNFPQTSAHLKSGCFQI